MDGYDLTTYGQRFADVYDQWYGHISDVDGTVSTVARTAAGGPVLELGVGTGRLALPLAATGAVVTGVDSSTEMLDLLRAKPGADAIRALTGDMAELEGLLANSAEADKFAVVLVAFNTFFNLSSADAQARCLRGVAAVLQPGGSLFLEAFVPQPDAPLAAVSPTRITADKVVLTATQVDPVAQTISGQHIDITEAGTRLRPWFIRYATPDQLDEAAAAASLQLVERNGGWRGEPFDGTSRLHVSRYQLAAG